MPFQIIRHDITKVHADAIVNTANPRPEYGGGTDYAVYQAAGAEALLAERKKIGRIAVGEANVTPAFRLNAKYIIHTVGPIWVDGEHREFENLASCYRKSLNLAQQLGCESIAFPLISTGTYGFPKDKALQIALDTVREFLTYSEMQVILVVFDRKAYELSAELGQDVRRFIVGSSWFRTHGSVCGRSCRWDLLSPETNGYSPCFRCSEIRESCRKALEKA